MLAGASKHTIKLEDVTALVRIQWRGGGGGGHTCAVSGWQRSHRSAADAARCSTSACALSSCCSWGVAASAAKPFSAAAGPSRPLSLSESQAAARVWLTWRRGAGHQVVRVLPQAEQLHGQAAKHPALLPDADNPLDGPLHLPAAPQARPCAPGCRTAPSAAGSTPASPCLIVARTARGSTR